MIQPEDKQEVDELTYALTAKVATIYFNEGVESVKSEIISGLKRGIADGKKVIDADSLISILEKIGRPKA